MNTPDDPELRDILLRALEVPAPERSPFLDAACAGNSSRRQQAEKLLQSLEGAKGFLENPTVAEDAAGGSARVHEQVGVIVGRYKLLEKIGEGGFGVVYMAEQETPVRRKVALKIIKLGMDTRQVIARFEAERQALAMMDHPGIAKVFDAGATETGRPYFVMELVHGSAVTHYCDDKCLSIVARLHLFVAICDALHHAHQKGIIHRDIKPSNILVAAQGDGILPKIIDFGIAKSLQGPLSDKPLTAGFRQSIGTPPYMSPEQTVESGEDSDVRTDVYSLGVLLYELLTGATPFDSATLHRSGHVEMQRVIREVIPPTPGTRIGALASQTRLRLAQERQCAPGQFHRLLNGDLTWIVMKAMEKQKAHRYESVSDLAKDIRAFLTHQPVSARPASALYHMRKFAHRHMTLIAACAVVTATLALGIVGTTIGLLRARTAQAAAQFDRDEAKRQAVTAKAVSTFLTDMLAAADPENQYGYRVTVLQATEGALKELDGGKVKDQPLVEAELRHVIGATLRSLGQYEQAEKQLRLSLALHRSNNPASYHDISATLTDLSFTLRALNETGAAQQFLQEALEMNRRNLPPDDPELANSLNNLSVLFVDLDKLEEAESLARESIAISRKHFPADSLELAAPLGNLGLVLLKLGKGAEAEEMFRQSITICQKDLPPDNPNLAAEILNLSKALEMQGKTDQAETLLRDSVGRLRRSLPDAHPDIAIAESNLAALLEKNNKHKEALTLFRSALEIRRKTFTGSHPKIVESLANLAQSEIRENPAESVSLIHDAIELSRRADPPRGAETAWLLSIFASILEDTGKPGDAEETYHESIALYRQRVSPNDSKLAIVLNDLGVLLINGDANEDAEPYLREAIDIHQKSAQPNHIAAGTAWVNLGRSLGNQDKYDDSAEALKEGLDIFRKWEPQSHKNELWALEKLSMLRCRQSNWSAMEPWVREWVEIMKTVPTPPRQLGEATYFYGSTLRMLNKTAEAYPIVLEARRLYESDPAPMNQDEKDTLFDILTDLNNFDTAKGRPEEAAKWLAEIEQFKLE